MGSVTLPTTDDSHSLQSPVGVCHHYEDSLPIRGVSHYIRWCQGFDPGLSICPPPLTGQYHHIQGGGWQGADTTGRGKTVQKRLADDAQTTVPDAYTGRIPATTTI